MWNWRRYPRGKPPHNVRFDRVRSPSGGTWTTPVAVATSILSLLVAALALWYTVDAQQRDQEHRELSIRPLLTVTSDTGNFRFVVENVGPGHAEIIAVFVYDREKCARADMSTPYVLAHELAESFEKRTTQFLRDTLAEYQKRSKRAINHMIQTRSLYVGDFIPPGRQVVLFELLPEAKDEIQKHNLWLAAKEEFSKSDLTGIGYRFCSVSRKYCRYVMSQDGFQLCRSLIEP